MKNKIMKFVPALSILTALVLVVAFLLEAAPFSNYYGKQTVRLYNELFFYNTSGTLKFSIANTGAVTTVGLSGVDSLTVAGETRIGGLANYDAMLTVKNNAVNSNAQEWLNSRGTSLAKIDSVGKLTADSAVVTGTGRFGGLVDYLSRFSIKNGLITNVISFFNSRGTAVMRIDSTGGIVGSSYLRDTSAFSTTLATKAIYIPGATPNDYYAVSIRTPIGTSTATPTDSCILTYMAKTDSLIVMRVGTYAASGGSMPSGTKFSYIRIR